MGKSAKKDSRVYSKFREERLHILKRPDTTVGGVANRDTVSFVYDDGRIDYHMIVKNPGLERIFLEVLSNAHDNARRSAYSKTPVKNIDVVIEKDGTIEVYNDGMGIRHISVTDEHGKVIEGSFAPTVIFSELRSGSNFDDDVVRNTSGRNGYGAKLTNIFSTEFKLESYDEVSKQVYTKVWYDNMARCSDDKFTKGKGKSGWTRIRFKPDYKRFGCNNLSDDMRNYFRKLVADVAMCQPKTRVTFNGQPFNIKSLKDYVQLYVGSKADMMEFKSADSHVIVVDCSPKVNDDEDEEKEKSMEADDDGDDGFEEARVRMANTSVSFVNGIYVHDGGIHVDKWIDAICKPYIDKLSVALKIKKREVKKNSDEKKPAKATKKPVKPAWMKLSLPDIRKHLAFFVVCDLDKPSFDSQTKLKLNGPAPKVTEPNATQLAKMCKWSIRAHIEYLLRAKTLAGQKKTDATRDGYKQVKKHTPANWFKTRNAHKTILIITEGDSAKGSATKAIDVLEGGNNVYGAFPVRGKLLNTRNASVEQINKNKEICELKQILGLKHGTNYEDDKELRKLNYGGVQIWADQDVDGDHIKGLLLNWFEENYPSLIKRGYVSAMNTPIVIARMSNKGSPIYFYELGKFRRWYDDMVQKGKKPIVKYIKGLGTLGDDIHEVISTSSRPINYSIQDEKDNDHMMMAFSKVRADDRKRWILQHDPENAMDPSEYKSIPLSSFVDNCLRPYSVETLRRCIPSMMDGMKEGQRKILFVGISTNIRKPIKVVQYGGRVLEHGAYHHGDSAMSETIIHMAQCWPGRNTIPLLLADGSFGSRFDGAKVYSQARYISTCLTGMADILFNKHDEPLYKYRVDDGISIEPEFYLPVLPTILFNNANGIATGWNCEIPSFNPTDVIAWIRAYIKGDVGEDNLLLPTGQLTPWFMNYKGTVTLEPPKEGSNISTHYVIHGVMEESAGRIKITEIPPSITPVSYLQFLHDLSAKKMLHKVINNCTSGTVNFEIQPADKKVDSKKLRLHQKKSLTKMVLLDEKGLPKRFRCAEEILLYWCHMRLQMYDLRKRYMISIMKQQLVYHNNKIRFIEMVNNGKLVLKNRPRADVISDMEKLKFDKKDDKYDYLLMMQIQSITQDKIRELQEEIDKLKKQIKKLQKTPYTDLWLDDIEKFEKAFEKHMEEKRKLMERKYTVVKKKGRK